MEFQHHNEPGGQIWLNLLCVLLTILGHFLSKIEHAHIPEVIMQLFQIGAWCSAIGVFIITIKRKGGKNG